MITGEHVSVYGNTFYLIIPKHPLYCDHANSAKKHKQFRFLCLNPPVFQASRNTGTCDRQEFVTANHSGKKRKEKINQIHNQHNSLEYPEKERKHW